MGQMRIGVVGSRGWSDYERVVQVLDALQPTEVVSGGAKGADSMGERYAKERGIPTRIFYPKPEDFGGNFGRAAFARNEDIVRNSDFIVAFWDGKSNGTKNSIDHAKRLGIPLMVIVPEGFCVL